MGKRGGRVARGQRLWPRRVALLIGTFLFLGTLGAAATVLWAFAVLPGSLPAVTNLETVKPIEGSKLYDENDELITEFRVKRRLFVSLAKIPKHLKDAILAVEDSRFYSHFGVDPIGIARAVYQNFRRGRIVEGGSTITQQLAKVLFLTPDKSLERKLKE
ncbi:MAG: transglycosylase domain-containing protein, partial [Candidatus Methylomirabilia bacterium]